MSIPGHLKPGRPDCEEFLRQQKLHIGLNDVKDCSHRLRQPNWLFEYCCLEAIPAHWVRLQGTLLDGARLGADDMIYPVPGSLCMGFT